MLVRIKSYYKNLNFFYCRNCLLVTYLMIIKSMLDLLPIHVDGVIVILGIHDQSTPFSPSGRYVRPIILVQVFAKITCNVKRNFSLTRVCGYLRNTQPEFINARSRNSCRILVCWWKKRPTRVECSSESFKLICLRLFLTKPVNK